MGMPVITAGTGTRDQSITDLIQSVALQETALSHILNAEGEKMQAIIAMPEITPGKLMELNSSVNKMINSVTRLEMMFQSKLELFSNNFTTSDNSLVATTAADELAKIDVPFVDVNVPTNDPTAQAAAAVTQVIAAAQAQVAPGYTVTFTPTAYYPAVTQAIATAQSQTIASTTTGYVLVGELTGKFTVTSNTNPSDTATDIADSTIEVFSTDTAPTTATNELAKISVPFATINVPLNDPTAQQEAVTQAIAVAQAQVDPGYTVTFTPTAYDPSTGTLTGKFTVTNSTDPTDTTTDAADRSISIVSLSTTPITAAEYELSKISVPSVTINVPLNDPTAQQAAITQAVAAAQAQVSPGYTVSFTPTAYDPSTGTLTGKFTVTNSTNPTDTATDAADRSIAVVSTATTPTTAANELSKISVPSVTINVPLNDPTAQQAAVTQAIAAAQTQVSPGYTVTFTPTAYDPSTGTLTGKFTVTNSTNPTDTATDATDRSIAVVSTASITASSNAAAQLLSGSLLGVDLSSMTGLLGATAYYQNGVTPGTADTENAGIDLSALNQTPLSGVIALGVVSQYAQASINGASKAISTVANAGLDLMPLLPANPLITAADVSIGAITGAAQWDASIGNTIASTTDVNNPSQGRDYNIANADLDLASPALGTLVTAIDNAAGTASTLVSGLGSNIINALLSGINSILSPLNSLVPGLSILSNNLSVNVSLVNLSTELAPLINDDITSGDGALTLNLGAGTVDVNLGNLTGLNGLPPNTNLLSSTSINAVVADLAEIIQALQTKVENLIMSKLNGTAAVTITGGVDLLDVLGVPTAGLNISYSGTLGDLVTNAAPLTITGTGTLAPFTSSITPLISTLQSTLGTILNPLINDPTTGIAATLNQALASALTTLSQSLSPLFQAIANAISIVVNVQQNGVVGGVNTFTEIPLQLNVLSDSDTLNLAKVVVGPNTYSVQ